MTIPAFLKRRGLGAYLALAFATLSALLTLLLVEVIGVTAGDEVRRNIGEGLAELALQTSDKLDRGMFERYREVGLIAQRFDPGAGPQDLARARSFLDSLQATYPYYAWIGAASVDGKVMVSTKGMLEGADVSRRPWFTHALKGNYAGDVHEALMLGRLLPNPTSEPLRFVDVAAPYNGRDGKPAGVLGAHLSWQWAREVEQSIIAPNLVHLRVESFILDKAGAVLLGPPGMAGHKLALPSIDAARRQGSGFRVETWPDGKQYLVGFSKNKGYASFPGLGWSVLVRQETGTAFGPVQLIQRQVLWSGIAVALGFALLGAVIAARISRPLTALTEAAGRIEQGEALAIPEYGADYIEVRELARSLSSLLAKLRQKEMDLQDLNLTLEKRVDLRTMELARALDGVKASEARLHTIIETVQDAFVGVDLRGLVTDWNSSAENMSGWSKAEALGRPVAELLIPPRFRAGFNAALVRFGQDRDNPFIHSRRERLVLDRGGREFPIEISIGLAGGGDQVFFGAFLHDISDRKKIERMKNEFISTVSHELRTPLTAIRLSLGLLTSGAAGQFEPDVKRLLDISQESCERLVRLINDILDIEKIESGNMTFHLLPQALLPVVEAAVEATRSYALPFQVALEVEHDGSAPRVALERDRITQVVVNLLSNAVKFSPPGGTVQIRVARDGATARLSVTDHGAGIPAEFQGRIFQKFAQADSTDTRQRSGTGLGLAICRQLVGAHGGQISFSTEAGVGTRFEVELPLAPAEEAA